MQQITSIIISVLALVALSSAAIQTVSAHTPNSLPYGEIGQEDESHFYHDGVLYINAVPSQGNGLFIAQTDIDEDYSIDQAIERFGIYEDTQMFYVQPSEYSTVTVKYQLDNDLQFNIVRIGDGADFDGEVLQMENNQ
jgi:hypothetical protein